jgi:hypothetical protein
VPDAASCARFASEILGRAITARWHAACCISLHEARPAHPGQPRKREAEREAQRDRVSGPRSPRVSLDELVAKGHTVIGRMEALVRRIAGRFGRR